MASCFPSVDTPCAKTGGVGDLHPAPPCLATRLIRSEKLRRPGREGDPHPRAPRHRPRTPAMSDPQEILRLEEAKSKAQKKNRTKRMADICHQLAKTLAKNGQFQEAIQQLEQELLLLTMRRDVIGCGVAHRMIGECFLELRNWEASLKHHWAFLELAQSITNYVEEQRAWMLIGRTYLFMHRCGQSSEALQEAQKAFVKSLEILDEKLEGTNVYKLSMMEVKEMRAGLYLNLGIVWNLMKDHVHSMEYIHRSIFIAQQNNLFSDLHRANYILGSIYQEDGQHSQALQRLEVARQSARKAKMASGESESCASMGEIHLKLGDFSSAMRQLKNAFSLASRTHCDRDKVKEHLQKAVKGVELEEALSKVPLDHRRKRMRIYEKLGDLCCKVKCYQKGLECYQNQLVCAEILQRSDEELAVIHFSLASTFHDLKDYKQAISHYETELQIRNGNPREECKTWLHIAEAKLKDGAGRDELDRCYQNALQRAQTVQDPRLQQKVLKALRKIQQNPSSSTEREVDGETDSTDSEEGVEVDDEMEDSELLKQNDPQLSANDKGRVGSSKSGGARIKNTKGHPLNVRDNAGWTPLHEACNHGHLEVVRLLLDSGANVNNPDDALCCGISPLHDALSCGKLEVAKLLIRRRASLTVRDAEGHTLADYFNEWTSHFKEEPDPETAQKWAEISELLRTDSEHECSTNTTPSQTGAEVNPSTQDFRYLCRDLFDSESSPPSGSLSSPDNALGYCQRGERSGLRDRANPPAGNESCPGARACPKAASWLPLRSRKVGFADPPRPCSSTATNARSSEEDDDFMPSPRPYKKLRPLFGQSSPAGQSSTEASSGHRSFNCRSAPDQQREAATDRAGTISSAEDSHTSAHATLNISSDDQTQPSLDDPSPSYRSTSPPEGGRLDDGWLQVDRSRTRPEAAQVVRAPMAGGARGSSPNGGQTGADFLRRPSSDIPAQTSASPSPSQPANRTMCKTPASSAMATSSRSQPSVQRTAASSSSPSSSALPSPIRVRVQVKDKLFLIPVPHSESDACSVSWLADEAAGRYEQLCGPRPRLSLSSHGALLSPRDLIVHVLQSNEEVLGEVQSWDLPPLSERYKEACHNLELAKDPSISKILQLQEKGPVIDLSALSLNKEQMTPILQALKLQTATSELRLSTNRLGDAAMDELLASLATMPNLTLLDLSSNQITHEGLEKLCDLLRLSGESPFQSLEELNLSLNPLGSSSSQFIASLIKSCPVLSTLKLQACGLTAKFLQHFALSCRLKGSTHLKTLILSHNALGLKGVQLLLKNLPHDVLSRLEISSVLGSQEDKPLVELVVKYLSQAGCTMTHLNLSKNSLTDVSIRDFARCLPSFPSLAFLDLSGNPGIGSVGLELLLAAFGERDSWMDVLDLSGCSISQHDMKSDTANWNLGDLRL
ncbi:tonsoku-like protein isoform X2 [Heptranchias perlo]|uniref:tonsoku-like protein isoform X2 n=1 Tax=Heptranchias perlo TaxID=212740 RepID=UPI00355A7189